MASDSWEVRALGDFCDMKYGKIIKKTDLLAEGYPVWSGYAVVGYHTDYMFEEPIVAITCRGVGGTGKVYMTPRQCWLTNLAISIVPRTDTEVDKRFLYWAMKASNRKTLITGSAQYQITIGHLERHKVPIPPLPEQRAIASILGALDDKIELNRRMNATLESLARAIFKSWFVDFDPVKINAGQMPASSAIPTTHDPKVLDLFPSTFQDSELGSIPEGWSVEEISTVADINYGKNLPKKKWLESGVPVYGAAGIVGYYTDAMFEEPVILVTSRGSNSGVVHQTYGRAFITNNSFTVVPKEPWFCRHYLRQFLKGADIRARVTGSAQPQLTVTNFSSLAVLAPSASVLESFHDTVNSIWECQNGHNAESSKLERHRDTLLPQLLSGELPVPAALTLAEEALA